MYKRSSSGKYYSTHLMSHTQSIHISSSSIHSFIHPSKRFSFSIHFAHRWKSFLFITQSYIQTWISIGNLCRVKKPSPQSRQYHHRHRHHRHSFRCHTFLEKSIRPNHVSTHITTSNYTFCASFLTYFQLFPLKSMWITWRSTFRFTSHVFVIFIHFFPSQVFQSLTHVYMNVGWVQFTAMQAIPLYNLFFLVMLGKLIHNESPF